MSKVQIDAEGLVSLIQNAIGLEKYHVIVPIVWEWTTGAELEITHLSQRVAELEASVDEWRDRYHEETWRRL